MKKYLILLIVLVFAVSCASGPQEKKAYSLEDSAVIEKLDSAEYKMLINLDDYVPENLWAEMKAAAENNGINVKENSKPMEIGYRQIQYLDNDSAMIKEAGYTLRYRQKFEKFEEEGFPGNVLDSKYDVTIKYRSKDISTAISIPLEVGKDFEKIKKDPELEADISASGITYSWAIKVKPKVSKYGEFSKLFEPKISSYAKLFPVLSSLSISDDSAIGPVGGVTLLEEKIEPALLYLENGIKMEVALSKFYLNGEALVAEVSFDFDTKGKMEVKDFKQTEKFFDELLSKYDTKLSDGWSKTTAVYKAAFPEM